MKISKKHALGMGAIILIVAILFVVAYVQKKKEKAEADAAPQAVIAADVAAGSTGPVCDARPLDVWETDDAEGYNGFTTRAHLGVAQGSIGTLTIEKIGVKCPVYDSENTMEDMKKGASHFTDSSYWDGNVGLSAHIGKLDYCYFDRLHELKKGDVLSYETVFGTRMYAVESIAVIADDDWSLLNRSADNRISLITCVAGKDSQRLCVQAVEVEANQ